MPAAVSAATLDSSGGGRDRSRHEPKERRILERGFGPQLWLLSAGPQRGLLHVLCRLPGWLHSFASRKARGFGPATVSSVGPSPPVDRKDSGDLAQRQCCRHWGPTREYVDGTSFGRPVNGRAQRPLGRNGIWEQRQVGKGVSDGTRALTNRHLFRSTVPLK